MAKNEGQLLDSELARQAGRDRTEQDVYIYVYYIVLDADFPSIPRISQRKKEIYNNIQYSGNRMFLRKIYIFLMLIDFSFRFARK